MGPEWSNLVEEREINERGEFSDKIGPPPTSGSPGMAANPVRHRVIRTGSGRVGTWIGLCLRMVWVWVGLNVNGGLESFKLGSEVSVSGFLGLGWVDPPGYIIIIISIIIIMF